MCNFVAVMRKLIYGRLCLMLLFAMCFRGSHATEVKLQGDVDPVVEIARGMFVADMASLPRDPYQNGIYVYQLDRISKKDLKRITSYGIDVDTLCTLIDGFELKCVDGRYIVAGTNGRGAAYGLLELSRMAGINPWTWWGDIPYIGVEEEKDTYVDTIQGAHVEYRGIFINDEDWSIRPWAGGITKEMYRRVFELLLRLRGNAIWPAMHEGSTAFFNVEGAKALADSFGIAVGSSHCEPLLRNNVGEWDVSERGRYNYITNRDAVQQYWIERLQEVKGSVGGNIFTIGMRGIHDGSMEGVKTMDEKFDALQQVINDQQALIREYIGDPSEQMQVFVPYKEVLQIYESGLQVPDYVTLMWCDDNYGYLTRLSDADEQQRSGGAGVYYHLSYWGRPHDYLWLTTTQPGLIYNELREAYDHNVRKLWIANVHDPKVAGYDLELFMDLAWQGYENIELPDHYHAWLCRQFGDRVGDTIFPAMCEWYRLCGQRKPEFMGWSQVELDKKVYNRGLSPVQDSEFSESEFGNELQTYLDRYADVCRKIVEAETSLSPELKDAYFAAVKYPVLASAAHAGKVLSMQRRDSVAATAAYEEVVNLTTYYNDSLAHGKWKNLMSANPRDLPVFRVPVINEDSASANVGLIEDDEARCSSPNYISHDAYAFDEISEGAEPVPMLGHSMDAVRLPKDGTLTYRFNIDERFANSLLRIALIPTQPMDDGDLRFAVCIDGGEEATFSLKEPFRSERWKTNVLRGQAVRTMDVGTLAEGIHTLTIRALDDHIIIDQWMLDGEPERKFYLFPSSNKK